MESDGQIDVGIRPLYDAGSDWKTPSRGTYKDELSLAIPKLTIAVTAPQDRFDRFPPVFLERSSLPRAREIFRGRWDGLLMVF